MHLEKHYSLDIKYFPQPLISTTITRCPASYINLSAIIVELRLAEYSSKLRRDLQFAKNGVTPDAFKIPPKNESWECCCKICSNILRIH